MTTIAVIAAAWLACSVAAYFALRYMRRETFGVWRRNDRWFCTAVSIFGPATLLAVIPAIAIAVIATSKRGNEILWRKDDC